MTPVIATILSERRTVPFVFTIQTTGSSESFTIPCQNVGIFNARISWGDGQSNRVTAYNDSGLAHVYAVAGTYTISIVGQFPNIYFNNGGDKAKVRTVEQLGIVGWARFNNSFYGCTGMTSFTAGPCNTSAVTDMANMFYGCTSLAVTDLLYLNTGAVTSMSFMFRSCSALTSLDLTSFDVSKVLQMTAMFRDCTLLADLDLSSFIPTKVTVISEMFYACSSLVTLDLSSFVTPALVTMNTVFLDCTSLTTLDISNLVTSEVTGMVQTFRGASALHSLDVSSFDTTKVTSMLQMFYGMGVFTSIVGLDGFNIGAVTSFSNFATLTTFTTTAYDALLIAWDAQDPVDSLSVNFGSSKYTGGGAAATARASLISTDSWSIIDGGIA